MGISEHSHHPFQEHSDTIESADNSLSDLNLPESQNLPKEYVLQKSIVGPAWELVTSTSLLKKFNFFPSLLSTIWLGCIILYQLAFSYVYIFQLKDQFFALIIQWVHTSYFWQIIGVLTVGALLYIFIAPIAE